MFSSTVAKSAIGPGRESRRGYGPESSAVFEGRLAYPDRVLWRGRHPQPPSAEYSVPQGLGIAKEGTTNVCAKIELQKDDCPFLPHSVAVVPI